VLTEVSPLPLPEVTLAVAAVVEVEAALMDIEGIAGPTGFLLQAETAKKTIARTAENSINFFIFPLS